MDGENTRKFLRGLTSHCLAQHISHCLFKETVIVNLVKQPNYVNTACLVDNTYNVLHNKGNVTFSYLSTLSTLLLKSMALEGLGTIK